MHNKRGYILFLLFSILSICMTLITLFFARSTAYQHLVHLLTRKEKATQIAISSTALGQAILHVPAKDKETNQQPSAKNAKQNNGDSQQQKQLMQIFPFLHTNTTYKTTESVEGVDSTIKLYLGCEEGKLNINSVYDFAEKKFVNEGKDGDRKKICQWMFDKISAITKKPSLFNAFEKHLKNREFDFNDVNELLHIKEFLEQFESHIFYDTSKKQSDTIYLTDLFTVTTEQETINPWFFSSSWQILLGIKTKQNITEEEIKKLLQNFKPKVNWEKDWNNSLRTIYQKEYTDLPKEIKSMLTTEYEANIFSLLLSATIGETTSTIFTILKKRTTATFDIVKVYQI